MLRPNRRRLWRIVFSLFGLLMVALIAVAAALRLWYIPHASEYRDQIAAVISKATGNPITIGAVQGAWEGSRPTLEFKDIIVYDDAQRAALKLDRIYGVLSWWSLLIGSIEFHRLEVDHPTLSIRREKSGKIFLAGIEIPQADSSGEASIGDWLLKQGTLLVNNGSLSWQDQTISDNVLVLTELGLRLENRGAHHRFGLNGRPPSEIASPVVVYGDVVGGKIAQWQHWRGEIVSELSNVDLATLRHFIPIPQELKQGLGGVRLVMKGNGNGHVEASADLALQNIRVQFNPEVPELVVAKVTGKLGLKDLAPGFEVTTQNLAVQLNEENKDWRPGDVKIVFHPANGNKSESTDITTKQIDLTGLLVVLQSVPLPADIHAKLRQFSPAGQLSNFTLGWTRAESKVTGYRLSGTFDKVNLAPAGNIPGFTGLSGTVDGTQQGGKLSINSRNATFKAPAFLVEVLPLDTLVAEARWQATKDGVNLNVDNFMFENGDGAISAKAIYQTVPGTLGFLDLDGKLLRGDARSVYRYVPTVVPIGVRDWLKNSLLAGKSESGSFKLKGNLYDFPFPNDDKGVFEFLAKAHDGSLRYAPNWPKVDDMNVDIAFRGITMDIVGTSAQVFGSRAKNVRIRIADLAHHDPVAIITAKAEGNVEDGLRYIAESGVRDMIGGATDRFTGSGKSKLDLQLTLPIARLHETQLSGDWEFLSGQVIDKLGAIPPLNKVTGHLQFSERGIEANKLKGDVLGGPAEAVFTTSKDRVISIKAKGRATAEGLYGAYQNAALKYFDGAGDWAGDIQVRKGETSIKIGAKGTLLDGPAKFVITNQNDGSVRIEGSGDAKLTGMKKHFNAEAMKFVTGDAGWNGTVTINKGKSDMRALATAPILGTPAKFKINNTADGTTILEGVGSVETAALEQQLQFALLKDFSKAADWTTKIKLREDKTEITVNSTAKFYGEPVTLAISNLGNDAWDIDAKGIATPTMLKQLYPQAWVDSLSGSATWTGHFTSKGKQYGGHIESNLRGLTSNLPEPFTKAAYDSWASRLDIGTASQGLERWQLRLGERLSAQLLSQEIGYGKHHIEKAEVVFGGEAPLPTRDGIWLSGQIGNLDGDGWRALARTMMGSSSDSGTNGHAKATINIGGAAFTANNMTLFQRSFTNFKCAVTAGKEVWNITLDGPDVRGDATWHPDGAGRIVARFSQLTLPPELPNISPRGGLAATGPGRLPSMDIVADRFQIGKRKWGRLELMATQEGQDWHMDRVQLSSPSGVFSADGVWQGWLDKPQTALNVNLRVSDLGQYLADAGYPKTVKRGSAEIKGRVSWTGDPYALDPPSLSGSFTLAAKSGQFLKVEPGIAKLLGLISLQSLPRRITFDFRDIFSDGFAFDDISADVTMNLGTLATDNFVMAGSAAGVLLQGTAFVRNETQDLRVKVVPSLGETVAIAGGLAGGPIVGVGAYILQKLLRNPIDKIFAYDYTVTGKWDDPVVTKVQRPQQEKRNIRR